MLTPDYLKNVSDDAIKAYSKLENSIIKDIVRRLENTNMEMTESARWQIQIAQESGLLYDEIIEEIAKRSDYNESVVRKTFEDSAVKSLNFDDKIYRRAGLKPIPIKQSKHMLNLLKDTLYKTNGSLQNLTLTTAKMGQNSYIDACNEAYMQIATGAFDYNTAIKKAINKISHAGAVVEYDSGYRCNIKSAVKRAVMTGVNQTCLKMQERRADEMGCDLVEVSAHGGARPEHAEWQGKVYSRSGKSKKYPSLADKTGYGTGPGLGGWNCRHSFFPYYEGISERAYTDIELEELKKEGEKVKVKDWQARTEEFAKANDIKRDYSREHIKEYKNVTNSKENDIILNDNEKFAINKYISSDSYKINEKLRYGLELEEEQKRTISNLDTMLDKMPNYKGNIVRVLNIENETLLRKFLDKNQIGKVEFWNEYLSFSNKEGYNSNANIKIYVKSSKAKDIRRYNKEENEILYKRNSKFITNNVIQKDGIYYILWEEVNG